MLIRASAMVGETMVANVPHCTYCDVLCWWLAFIRPVSVLCAGVAIMPHSCDVIVNARWEIVTAKGKIGVSDFEMGSMPMCSGWGLDHLLFFLLHEDRGGVKPWPWREEI